MVNNSILQSWKTHEEDKTRARCYFHRKNQNLKRVSSNCVMYGENVVSLRLKVGSCLNNKSLKHLNLDSLVVALHMPPSLKYTKFPLILIGQKDSLVSSELRNDLMVFWGQSISYKAMPTASYISIQKQRLGFASFVFHIPKQYLLSHKVSLGEKYTNAYDISLIRSIHISFSQILEPMRIT